MGPANTALWEDWDTPSVAPQFGFEEDVGYWVTILVFNPAKDVCFLGEIASEQRTIQMEQGRNLCGSAYPIEVPLADSGLIASGFTGSSSKFFSDNIEWWNTGGARSAGNYDLVWYDTSAGGWKNW